jgi:dTDP-glucose pyrophosphorylase
MARLEDISVSPDSTVYRAVEVIEKGGASIAAIVDVDGKLLGLATDGDVRRGILNGVLLVDPVSQVMNVAPKTLPAGTPGDEVLAVCRKQGMKHMPIVDAQGMLVDLVVVPESVPEARDNWVVLMAGGKGTRLRPYTEDCPKPMLPVGNRPVLETIIRNFQKAGFRNFYLSVNYMAEVIQDYFGDGSRFGVRIEYLHEREKLGTAGALSLLPSTPESPIFVMNGDVLTNVDFNILLGFHRQQKADATMCVRDYEFQVPYGVVRTDRGCITSIDEKPVQRFFVNAGIYVIEPKVLAMIPARKSLDMPTLFEMVLQKGWRPSAFPVREYWLDIGRPADFERANGEYFQIFGE